MKIWAIILIILSLSKLCIVGSQKQELAKDLFYQIKDNLENFQKKAIIILIIDGLLGLICGIFILL